MSERFQRFVALVVPVTCPVLLCACIFGGNGRGSAVSAERGDAGAGPQSAWWPADAGMRVPSEADAALPTPFTKALTTLITQPVRWADVDVSVTSARLERGLSGAVMAPVSSWDAASFDPTKVYAVIELKLQNKGDKEADYSDRSTWDLLLKNGDRLGSIDAVGISVLPGDAGASTLHYAAAADAVLEGAQLVLNGDDRTTLEPEQIALDAKYVQGFPRRITSMVGQTIPFKESDWDPCAAHVDEAVVDTGYRRAGRADRGTRVVWLTLAFTTKPNGSNYVNSGELRIIVDGRASAAAHDWYQYGGVGAGITVVRSVGFEIDKSATRFEIMIPDGTPTGARFPVNVADTVLATDIP